MTAVTINGNAYSDDGTQTRDMRFGGHQTWLLPMLQDTMTEVEAATDAAVSADSSAAAALASATDSATYAAGLNGTSTSANDIGTGSKTWTTQAGKQFGVGGYVHVIRQSDTTMWMIGQVTAYNTGTGSITVNVEDSNGSGNFSGWDIRVSGKRGAQGIQGIDGAGIPTTTGNAYKHLRVNSAATGAEWVDRPFSGVQVITSTTTFTPPAGVTKFFVILQGAGGGGSDAAGQISGFGGDCLIGLMEITSAQTVTIGAGGTGGATQTKGGDTSVGTLAVARGGDQYFYNASAGESTVATGLVVAKGGKAYEQGGSFGASFLTPHRRTHQSDTSPRYGSGGASSATSGDWRNGANGIAIIMW